MKIYKRNYVLKVTEDDREIDIVRTHSITVFLRHLRTINWQKTMIRVYVKVSYGKQKDVHGKLVTFYNDGDYETKTELIEAFKAFTEQNQSTDNGSTRNNYRNG